MGIEDRTDELLAEFRQNPDLIEAADVEAGCEWFGGWEPKAEVQALFAELHTKAPDDLIGSDLLTRLYRMARQAHTNREAQLRKLAEEHAEREDAQWQAESEEMRAFYRDQSRSAA